MTETVVYIHGIVGESDPRVSHDAAYEALRSGLTARGVALPPLAESITVEWGWETGEAGASANLSVAQRTIGRRIEDAATVDRWSVRALVGAPLVPPIRDLILYGFSDMLYYTGREGKLRVREAVWKAILAGVGPGVEADLTIIAHSGGSLIAHDFLFWIFSGERDDRLESELGDAAAEAVRAARSNWRVRRLVTMGSPLAPLMVRSGHLVDLLSAPGEPAVEGASIGLDLPAHSGVLPLWLNLWDRHDPISFPLAGLYRNERIVDLYTDHSDSVTRSHTLYWTSPTVHDLLAAHWDD